MPLPFNLKITDQDQETYCYAMPFKNSLQIDEIFASNTKGTAINTSNISKIMNGIKWYVQSQNQIKNYILP